MGYEHTQQGLGYEQYLKRWQGKGGHPFGNENYHIKQQNVKGRIASAAFPTSSCPKKEVLKREAGSGDTTVMREGERAKAPPGTIRVA